MRELIPYAGQERPPQRHGRGALVRYAGFDPDEDDFSDVTPAALHPRDLEKPPREAFTRIDKARIAHLRGLGWTWDAVGVQIAIEQGRRMPYRGNSLWRAMHAKQG